MHFNNRFLKTLGVLFSSPGLLSFEYKKGNRSAYLSPVVIFLFSTGLFFLFFFTGFRNENFSFSDARSKSFRQMGTIHLLREGYKNAKNKEDSLKIEKAIKSLEDSTEDSKDDSNTDAIPLQLYNSPDTVYKSVAAYDSAQQLLPAEKKDGWYNKAVTHRIITLRERYRNNAPQFWIDIINKFIHYFPYLIFILFPLYTLFLKLIYIRNKAFFFSDHAVFLAHIYTFLFILLLAYLGPLWLKKYTDSGRLIFTAMVILTAGGIYTSRAMKRFYQQDWAKTIFLFTLFNLLCIAVLLAAFVLAFGFLIPWF